MEVIYKGSADGIRLRLGIGIVATIGGSQQMKLHPLQGTRNGDAIRAREREKEESREHAVWRAHLNQIIVNCVK